MKSKKKQTAALACALLLSSGYYATAMTTEYRTYGNGFTIELNFYDADDWNMDSALGFESKQEHFSYTENMKNAIREAVDYWGDLLGKGAKATQPVQIFIRSDGENYGNAFAGPEQNAPYPEWYIADQIIKGKVLLPYNGTDQYTDLPDTEPMAFGRITFSKALKSKNILSDYGWDTEKIHSITGNNGNYGLAMNLMNVAVHELGHIFGLNDYNHYMAEHMSDYSQVLNWV